MVTIHPHCHQDKKRETEKKQRSRVREAKKSARNKDREKRKIKLYDEKTKGAEYEVYDQQICRGEQGEKARQKRRSQEGR